MTFHISHAPFQPKPKGGPMLHQTPQRKTHSHSQSEAKEGNIILLFHLFFFFAPLYSIPFQIKPSNQFYPPLEPIFPFPSSVSALASRPRTPRARNAHPTRRRRLTPPSPHPQYNHASIFSSSPSPPPHRHRRGPNSQPSKRPNPASPAAGDLRSGP